MKLRTLLVSIAVVLVAASGAVCSAELIYNGGMELHSGAYSQSNPLSLGWSYVTTYPPAYPVTYCTDGSWGSSPSVAFPGLSDAEAVVRWIAALDGYNTWVTEREAVGQTLLTTLVPGTQYLLSADLAESPYYTNPGTGTFDVYLTSGPPNLSNLTSLQFLGEFAFTTGTHNWEYRELTFNAPANAASLPQIWFVTTASERSLKYVGGAYIALDDVSLNASPEPSTFALLGIGAVSLLGCAWRRRKRAT